MVLLQSVMNWNGFMQVKILLLLLSEYFLIFDALGEDIIDTLWKLTRDINEETQTFQEKSNELKEKLWNDYFQTDYYMRFCSTLVRKRAFIKCY